MLVPAVSTQAASTPPSGRDTTVPQVAPYRDLTAAFQKATEIDWPVATTAAGRERPGLRYSQSAPPATVWECTASPSSLEARVAVITVQARFVTGACTAGWVGGLADGVGKLAAIDRLT